MKRKTLLVTLGMLLTVLLGVSLVGTQPGYTQINNDCETARYNAFMNATDQYTNTLYSWWLGQPLSCADECNPQCAVFALNVPAYSTCMSSCIAGCDSSRYNSFLGAQDALIAAANRTCQYNPDFCRTAQATFDQCQFNYESQMANPVLVENGDIDGIWEDAIYTEYMACRTASGIDQCR
jgi:hypothetical protein